MDNKQENINMVTINEQEYYDLKKVKKEYCKLKTENDILRKKILFFDANTNYEINKLKTECNELQHKYNRLDIDYEIIKYEYFDLKEKYSNLEEENKNIIKENLELKQENKKLKEKIAELEEENKIKDIKIAELENENINLKEHIKVLYKRIDILEFEKIFRDYMMTTAEGIVLFQTNIIKEVYADNYDPEITYKSLLIAVKNNKLTQEQLERFNNINAYYKHKFKNGIYDLNKFLRLLKEERNDNSHDYYRSSKLTIDELKEKMLNYIENTDKEEIKNLSKCLKLVIDLIIENIKENNGEKPFDTDEYSDLEDVLV